MLWLKLLGTPVVEVDGASVVGRAARSHRLALLAVLSLARGRPVPRDKVTALLWPESPTDRARHQLSDALYILRTAPGMDVIRATGDELVLDPDAVASDVGTFERLLDDGQPEAAVELFTGPLLDGFHLSDGGELERWLDAERTRLGQRYAAALESLAQGSEARGELVAAEGWWRRLATHDPYSGRVALRLMRALDAVGDRASALRHARVHAALLQDEFAAGPDPAVTGFAERLRAEPPARAAPQPAAVPPAPPTRRPEAVLTPNGAGPPTVAPGVVASPPAPVSARRRSPAWGYAVATAALLVLAAALIGGVSRARDATAPAARSLAVLPFVNMSPDPRNGYFSDGLSEQIITALSGIQGLRVVARTSSFALRGGELDVRVIGDTLGVEAVLEGSVRQEGSRLRVTAQLIDAGTGYHLWSGEYDREVADVLAVQDEIAGAIAAALELRLPARAAPSRGRRAPDPRAYDLYLRALHLRDELSGDALRAATELLDQAIELEPGFALAWAAKASVAAPRVYYRHVPREEGVAEMRAAVARALALDPELGEAHVALGILRLFFDWDWVGAERALRRAVALNPSDPHAWHHLGNQLRAVGRMEEAVDARARSVALDPLNARMRIVLATDLSMAGRHEEAMAQHERTRRLDPMIPQALGLGPSPPAGVRIHLARGRDEDAVQELLRVASLRGATQDELDALRAAYTEAGMRGVWRSWLDVDLRQSGGAVNPLRLAMLWASIGDTDQALDWLERAHAERNPGLIFLQHERAFTELRSHPRFARIVAEMKFPAPPPPRSP